MEIFYDKIIQIIQMEWRQNSDNINTLQTSWVYLSLHERRDNSALLADVKSYRLWCVDIRQSTEPSALHFTFHIFVEQV